MKIFLLISFLILAIFIISKKVFYSAKKNLFKDQLAWSNKEIKIKHNNSEKAAESNRNENYLKIIAEESEVFLEDQSF